MRGPSTAGPLESRRNRNLGSETHFNFNIMSNPSYPDDCPNPEAFFPPETPPAETSGASLDDIDEAARQCVRQTLEHEEAAWTPCSKIIRELVASRELRAVRAAGAEAFAQENLQILKDDARRMRGEIERLTSELTAAKSTPGVASIKALLADDQPYSLSEVLAHLAKASDILFEHYEYRGDGWESIRTAQFHVANFQEEISKLHAVKQEQTGGAT